jgi:hypothetical protein
LAPLSAPDDDTKLRGAWYGEQVIYIFYRSYFRDLYI